jgi:cytochrome c5
MSDQHETPIKTPRQLIIVIVLAFIVPITLMVLLSQLVTSGEKGLQDNHNAVLARIKAVGEVTLAAPSGPKGQATGAEVYNLVCKTCHEAGLAGAPKVGDKAAWGKAIAQGQPTTVNHAVNGIRGMPAKGGNPDLETVEVERAVVFMANQAGASWKEPAAAAPTADRTGEQVVAAACGKCHQTGVGGAPKIGDRAAWTPRVAKGLAYVTQSALKGHGGMPARGGMAELSDVEVKRAIEYMFNSGTVSAAAAK